MECVRNASVGAYTPVTGYLKACVSPRHSSYGDWHSILFSLLMLCTFFQFPNLLSHLWFVNFNFNRQHTIRWLDFGWHIYKYSILDACTHRWITVLCNSAPWWWSKVTETCRCNELRKHIICAFRWFLLIILKTSSQFMSFRHTIILSLVLYGCENWSLILTE